MAVKDDDELDLDVKPKSSGKKPLILYGVIAVLLLSLVGMGAFVFLGQKGNGQGEGTGNKIAETKQAHYLDLRKMVVNFSPGSPVRYLQINLQVMSYDRNALKVVDTHLPAIRNDILLLLGSQSHDVVSTPEGKEQLRMDILAKIQHVLDANDKGAKVDAVYYTEFIMQ
ncbi:MAG: flagellar basal body-associated protein FliL [Thiohalomonadaceae bacterium]